MLTFPLLTHLQFLRSHFAAMLVCALLRASLTVFGFPLGFNVTPWLVFVSLALSAYLSKSVANQPRSTMNVCFIVLISDSYENE